MNNEKPATPAISVFFFPSGAPEFQSAQSIRRQVFIEEQNLPETEEWDAEDHIATHVLVAVDMVPAGTARFYPDADWLKIGRIAVLPAFRGRGLGRVLLQSSMEKGKAEGYTRAFLNAQSDKLPFYEKLGFRPCGGDFDEAGIPHRRMEREL